MVIDPFVHYHQIASPAIAWVSITVDHALISARVRDQPMEGQDAVDALAVIIAHHCPNPARPLADKPIAPHHEWRVLGIDERQRAISEADGQYILGQAWCDKGLYTHLGRVVIEVAPTLALTDLVDSAPVDAI